MESNEYAASYNKLVATPYEKLKSTPDPYNTKKAPYFWVDRINFEKPGGISNNDKASYKDFLISCIISCKYQYVPYLLDVIGEYNYTSWNVNVVEYCFTRALDKNSDKANHYSKILRRLMSKVQNPLNVMPFGYSSDLDVLNGCDDLKKYVFEDLKSTAEDKATLVNSILYNRYKKETHKKNCEIVGYNMAFLDKYLGDTMHRINADLAYLGEELLKGDNSGERVYLFGNVAMWFYETAIKLNTSVATEKAVKESKRFAIIIHGRKHGKVSVDMLIALGEAPPFNVKLEKKVHRDMRFPRKGRTLTTVVTEGDVYEAAMLFVREDLDTLKELQWRKVLSGNKIELSLISPTGIRSIFLHPDLLSIGDNPFRNSEGLTLGEYIKMFKPSHIEQIKVVVWKQHI